MQVEFKYPYVELLNGMKRYVSEETGRDIDALIESVGRVSGTQSLNAFLADCRDVGDAILNDVRELNPHMIAFFEVFPPVGMISIKED